NDLLHARQKVIELPCGQHVERLPDPLLDKLFRQIIELPPQRIEVAQLLDSLVQIQPVLGLHSQERSQKLATFIGKAAQLRTRATIPFRRDSELAVSPLSNNHAYPAVHRATVRIRR